MYHSDRYLNVIIYSNPEFVLVNHMQNIFIISQESLNVLNSINFTIEVLVTNSTTTHY